MPKWQFHTAISLEGRSKRDAKHLAASNIMRKLCKVPGLSHLGVDVNDNCQDNLNMTSVVDELTNINRDMLKELRDYCVRHDIPLPIIEIVQQSGSPNAPEFVACCSVASIKRYGKSDKKKDARQRAAIEMLCVISNDSNNANPDNQVACTKAKNVNDLDSSIEDVETERRRKFKTYRELTDAGCEDTQSVKLCDRHNYFKSYYPHLKQAAFEAMNNDSYLSGKDKLLAVLEALKLTPRITTLESSSFEPLLMLELNCEYDCIFVGLESKIYGEIVEYFRDMLV